MSFDFLKDLSEARVFRNATKLPEVSVGTIGENFFNSAMALQIMAYENPKAAQRYAQTTLAGGLDGWRSSGSDMNNMAQILMNPDRYSDRINYDQRVSFPKLQFKNWLNGIAKNKPDPSYDRRFFLALQRQLGVKNPGLLSARRVVADWSSSLGNERVGAAQRVHRGLSKDLKQSDLFSPFNRVMNKRGTWKDPKAGGSIPLWAKLAAAGAGGYLVGKSVSKW